MGRIIGNDITVKSEPFPPAFAAIAARNVVDEDMEMPPEITMNIKKSMDLTSTRMKNIYSGVMKYCSNRNNTILYISFDIKIASGTAHNRNRREVPSSSSLMKICDRPFIALKNIITQKIIAWVLEVIGMPPEERLTASVVIIAKERVMLRA